MRLLKIAFHPDISPEDITSASELTRVERHAARGIVLKGDKILLLYTKRYHDYSLPGGGIDEGEDEVAGLIRELQEETGALGVRNIKPFARYDEYRPWYKSEADIIHIISYCYVCDIIVMCMMVFNQRMYIAVVDACCGYAFKTLRFLETYILQKRHVFLRSLQIEATPPIPNRYE